MHKIQCVIIVILLLSLASVVQGQKRIERQADTYFSFKKYEEAIDLYEQIERKDGELMAKLGYALYEVGKEKAALKYISEAYKKGNKEAQLYLYAAKCLHKLDRLEEAAVFYKNYLSRTGDMSVVNEIKNIGYAITHKYHDKKAFVENMGSGINSVDNDIRPVLSKNFDNTFYFSSNREGSTGGPRNEDGLQDLLYGRQAYDIYKGREINGKSSLDLSFGGLINSPFNDYLQGFDETGSAVFFTTYDHKNIPKGMYVDTFTQNSTEAIFRWEYDSPVDVHRGDKDLYYFSDSILLFTSKALPGFGGYDLFYTKRQNNTWLPPVNLGSAINTADDERSPFLSPDGGSLYFSSNRLGYGGFDIFLSRYGYESQSWEAPLNLKTPINSTGDDLHYTVSADNRIAYFSSNRAGGIGKYDIYRALILEPGYAEIKNYGLPLFAKKSPLDLSQDSSEVNIKVEATSSDQTVKDEIVVKPLYFNKDEDVLTLVNRDLIDQLVDHCKVFPQLNVTLLSHTKDSNIDAFNLYFSVKRAEKVKEYMVEAGIDPNRVSIAGLGAYYINSYSAKRSKNRMDIRLEGSEESLKVFYEGTPEHDLASNQSYKQSLHELSFMIYFTSSEQMLEDPLLSQNNVIVTKGESHYDYYIGIYDSFDMARKVQSNLAQMGYDLAAIIPLYQWKKLSDETIQELRTKYPDLEKYLQYR